MKLKAYCDDLNEFEWFITLDRRLERADFHRIGSRGSNGEVIDFLIEYDRPDVILLADGVPVLTVEKTREVPTGHNIGQRAARLVRSLERGIPTIYFLPFDARKGGRHTSVCNFNARGLKAFDRMWELHNTPMLAVNWPSDERGVLIPDETADFELQQIVKHLVDSNFDKKHRLLEQKRIDQIQEYERRVANFPSYGRPPKTLLLESTAKSLSFFRLGKTDELTTHLQQYEETATYVVGMTEAACRREDPFTGMQFIYDYLYCRTGPAVHQKSRNLVLYFPQIRKTVWNAKNPNDPSRKSSNWYLTANALVFKDGWILLR